MNWAGAERQLFLDNTLGKIGKESHPWRLRSERIPSDRTEICSRQFPLSKYLTVRGQE